MYAAISYAGHVRRVAGERVRFIRRTSRTKGVIVEIRIRPKHITLRSPRAGGTIGAVRRLRAQRLCSRYKGDLIENGARTRGALTFYLCARERLAVICERISHIYEHRKMELFRAATACSKE